MTPPRHTTSDAASSAAARASGLLDTQPEERFDRITRLAAVLFDVPIALISLIDGDRQWFKSRIGIDVGQTPIGDSFCAYAVGGQDVMVVPDALNDPRFAKNRLVTGAPHIRFYAGAPLIMPSGACAGTLCIIDSIPRAGLTPNERHDLARLAAMVVQEIAARKAENWTERRTLAAIAAGKIILLGASTTAAWLLATTQDWPLPTTLAVAGGLSSLAIVPRAIWRERHNQGVTRKLREEAAHLAGMIALMGQGLMRPEDIARRLRDIARDEARWRELLRENGFEARFEQTRELLQVRLRFGEERLRREQVEREVRAVLDSLYQTAETRLTAAITDTEHAANDILGHTQEIDRQAASFASFVSETNDSTAALLASGGSGKLTEGGVLGELQTYLARRETVLAAQREALDQVFGGLSRVQDAVRSIDQIVGRTRLVALNATIEATHAGEAGQGFAVVAEEVRALLRQTDTAAGIIRAGLTNFGDTLNRFMAGIGNEGEVARERAMIEAMVAEVETLQRAYRAVASQHGAAAAQLDSFASGLTQAVLPLFGAIQFQDIVRQRIEGVICSIRALRDEDAFRAREAMERQPNIGGADIEAVLF